MIWLSQVNTGHDPKLSWPNHWALMVELAPIAILTFEHFKNNIKGVNQRTLTYLAPLHI